MIVTRHERGALLACLNVLAAHNINLTKLESRPKPGSPFEYQFYIDVEGNVADANLQRALDEMTGLTRSIKIFGSVPVAHPDLRRSTRLRDVMPKPSAMPDWLEPMAATLTQERFAGPDWLFERKFDGIRLIAYKQGRNVRLYSRNRLLQRLPEVERAVAALKVDDVILDGEVAWDGRSSYHVFDIMWLDGKSTTGLPLEERRALLERFDFKTPLSRVPLLDDPAPWERAKREGWEGVIAKRRGSPYEHRRSKHWLKMKCEASQEFVVGGFTDPQGGTRRPRRAAHRVLRRQRLRVRGKDRNRF